MSRLTLDKKGQIVEKRLKYRNKITEVDGIKFHSTMEANRWRELKLLEKAGEIFNLKRQVKFYLVVNEITVGSYTCDFTYEEVISIPSCGASIIQDVLVVEDVKGVKTELFKLKWNLMYMSYRYGIQEGAFILRLVKKNGVIEDNNFFNIKRKEKNSEVLVWKR